TASKVEMTLVLSPTAVEPGRAATVNLTIETLKVSNKTGDEKIDFDSSKPVGGEDDIVGSLMRSIIGTTMTLKVDSAGNITSITGGEGLAGLSQFVGGGGSGQLFGPIVSGRHGNGMARVGESWADVDTID